MAGRTLDQLVMDALGMKEMVILRLQWQIEDLKAQIAELQPQDNRAKGTDGIDTGSN